MARSAASAPDISVVVPVFDEEGAAPDLAREIAAAFQGRNYEMVFVDDRSRDGTIAALTALKSEIPQLRILTHRSNSGQSRAIRTGILAARGDIIVTLDGDGQNDPADGPKLVDALLAGPASLALVGGERVKRQDSQAKKIASKFGNGVRKRMLKDTANDTGCGLKLFEREAFLDLPYFNHMHRYLPALMQRAGWKTVSVPVNHRHRASGVSKYNNLNRALVGLRDLRGVAWLIVRSKRTAVEEL